LDLVRSGQASTRGELAAMTGLARSTIAQRVDALLTHRLLIPGGDSASTGGRRPTRLAFNRDAGVVLAGDVGATHSRVAVTDLAGEVLAQDVHDIAVAEGPDIVLAWLEQTFDRLLLEIGRAVEDVRGIGVGLPGPVEFAAGRPVSPPIMPGWNLYPVGERLGDRFSAPALVDNDVNIMGLGEYWSNWRDEEVLLFVKVGTGIGSGIVTHGRVHRGADGAAGDIGHIHVPDYDDVVCRCGNLGCLEAIAGGAALATRLRDMGLDTRTGRDVVAQVLHGQHDAVRLIRQAGLTIGGVLATCVNMLNPAVIVIGGDMAGAGEPLLAGIREVVYRRSLPLATGSLRIAPSELGDEAGITGAAVMVIETILAPAAVDALVSAV
jgi:predicted NBD/HSP70 family sugar kinase